MSASRFGRYLLEVQAAFVEDDIAIDMAQARWEIRVMRGGIVQLGPSNHNRLSDGPLHGNIGIGPSLGVKFRQNLSEQPKIHASRQGEIQAAIRTESRQPAYLQVGIRAVKMGLLNSYCVAA